MRGVGDLLIPVLRTLPWRALGVGAAAGLVVVGTTRLFPDGVDAWVALNALRAAALAFALGLAFLLDDPARHTTAVVPTPRPARQALRLALVAPVAALWWTAAVLTVPAELRPPVGAVTLQAAAICALALAGAAGALRVTDEPRPGTAVAAALLVVAVVAPLLMPDDWEMFAAPGAPGWATAHQGWAVVVAGAALGWVVWGREPVRRLRVRR
ncbi:ABC transporter [Streptomyces sp. TRM68416]|nr:ABC transporter [Streptomyces sp. TRM68416]MBD0840434.1 ABC transporter [Streptomyces sp. TRM68416]